MFTEFQICHWHSQCQTPVDHYKIGQIISIKVASHSMLLHTDNVPTASASWVSIKFLSHSLGPRTVTFPTITIDTVTVTVTRTYWVSPGRSRSRRFSLETWLWPQDSDDTIMIAPVKKCVATYWTSRITISLQVQVVLHELFRRTVVTVLATSTARRGRRPLRGRCCPQVCAGFGPWPLPTVTVTVTVTSRKAWASYDGSMIVGLFRLTYPGSTGGFVWCPSPRD